MLDAAYPNLQLSVGTTLATDPRDIDDRPKSGDLQVSALYNFNQETISLPAFALKVGVDTPTGVGARGYGIELKGIITKSIERLNLHLNAGYEFRTSTTRDQRHGRYRLSSGATYPIGPPRFPRALSGAANGRGPGRGRSHLDVLDAPRGAPDRPGHMSEVRHGPGAARGDCGRRGTERRTGRHDPALLGEPGAYRSGPRCGDVR